jgi:hypothetical protein
VIGWGDFGTTDSGILGYTNVSTTGDLIMPGAVVRLEDPSETALINGAAGLTYQNTDATLYQVALHEIGHALGLGDDSDPASAMYYALGSANRSLDSTDIGAIAQIYGGIPGAVGGTA